MLEQLNQYRSYFFAGLFALATIVVCHRSYSWMGFNPTDDGYHLAGARRILDGQIPHRDFITIRPAGSFYLHAPVVAFGGEHMLLLSRLVVWAEVVIMIWAWLYTIDHYLALKFDQQPLTLGLFCLWSLLGLIFSLHSFPVMAWHTIDGLFVSSVGLALLHNSHRPIRLFGYALIGSAPLFKQNFLALPPLIWLLTGCWAKKESFWESLIMALPLIAYVGILFLLGAGYELQTQLLTHTELSFRTYLQWPDWLRFVGWGAALGLALHSRRPAIKALGLGMLGYALIQTRNSFWAAVVYINTFSFYFFQIGLGCWFFLVTQKQKNLSAIQVLGLALAMSWVASISIGYASPALGMGFVVIALLAWVYQQLKTHDQIAFLYLVGTGLVLLLCFRSFEWMRQEGVYRDQPARLLKSELGPVFKGATGIKSNEHLAADLADLQTTIQSISPRPYAIVPDFPAYWMSSDQPNPLSIDWPQQTELANEHLKQRIAHDLDRLKQTGGVVIVEKTNVSTLANGFQPIGDNQYFVIEYIEQNWRLAKETTHFFVYE